MEDHDRDELLKILEDHGKQFLSSFALPSRSDENRTRSDANRRTSRTKSQSELSEGELEDWNGFGTGSSDSNEEDSHDSDISDDDFTADTSTHIPNIVVFADHKPKPTNAELDMSGAKAFMSSKISKFRQDTTSSRTSKGPKKEKNEVDVTNARNDALLHRLVHTKLLSGSLDPGLNLSGSQRRKALEGRVLELTGKSKLGKGEMLVRQAERNLAAKRVRLGIEAKRKERLKKELEAAKDQGNYHPTLRKVYEESLDTGKTGKKRVRGLKMGVGRFQGGVLKLGQKEISSMERTLNSQSVKVNRKRKRKG